MSHAINILDWVEDQDASVEFTTPIIDLNHRTESLAFQVAWTQGVTGTFVWEVCIIPDLWEQYISCEPVNLEIVGDEAQLHSIIVIPKNYLAAASMRVRFISEDNSSGTYTIAQRICPN